MSERELISVALGSTPKPTHVATLDGASGASGYALMTRYSTARLGRQRILGPGLALISPVALPTNPPAALQRCFTAAQQAVNDWCDEAKITA